MLERRILTLILVAFVLLGSTYAITTPAFEASDELWHYPMIRHLADGNPLPVQVFDPALAGPWKQEASQPPLYYYLGAALTFWIDASDMEEVRWQNPHVDNGVVTVDGNTNLIVHDPQRSLWEGALLAVRIVRLASVLMGAVTVFFTYMIAREVAPSRPEIALGAAAINAFTPMFLFISGAVNNDNLAIMLASIAIFQMMRIVRMRRMDKVAGAPTSAWVLLGVVIGLAVLTKEGTLGLVPLLLGTAAIDSWLKIRLRQEEREEGRRTMRAWGQITRRTITLALLTIVPVLIIAGWWYYRNIVLYGDWLGWNAFIAVLGERPQPATLAQLWSERWGFLASYWGLFGGVNVPMAGWIYTVLNALLVMAVPGFVLYCWGRFRKDSGVDGRSTQPAPALTRAIDWLFDFVATNFALVVAILFSLAVVVGLVNWATTTWSSQGRLAFTAISTLSALLACGLVGWLRPRAARVVAAGISGFMLAVSAAAPFMWIAPAYVPEEATSPIPLQETGVVFGDTMALTGFAVVTEGDSSGDVVHPGDTLDVYLSWRVLESTSHNWSVFVHVNDPVLETPLAQRDMYPGGGLVATSFLETGDTLVDRFRLRIPRTAAAPSQLDVVVGLYDFYTNERLASSSGEAAALTQLELEATSGDATTLATNFGNQLALMDFTVTPRRVAAGEHIALQTEWQGVGVPDRDYTIFAQVLGEGDTTRWAAVDIAVESSQWLNNERHRIDLPLDVDPQTPPGIYTVVIGAYTREEDGGFRRLQVVEDGRITMDDVLQLTRITIE